MDREYYKRNFGEYWDKKIFPVVFFAVALLLLSQSVWGATPEYYCYDNDTRVRTIDVSFNGTAIGLIEFNETCPYGCYDNVTTTGAVCGYAPIELTTWTLIGLIAFFGIIYGWARLTYKKKRRF